MASTYSDLKIELIGTGEQVGTWGATTNTNLGTAIEDAITGSADVAFSSADVTLTLTNTNGSQTARNLRLVCTGTSGGARNLILGSGCQINKLYLVQNDLADTVTVKNTTGTGVAIPAGAKKFVFNDGTNVVEATTGDVVNLATGVTGTLPVANGGTGAASLTANSVILGNGSSALSGNLVAPGTSGNVLASNGTTWASTSLGAVVTGPASSTDNAIARFDSTTGRLLQNSTATLSDAGAPTFVGAVNVSGTSSAGSNIKLYEDTDNGTNYVSLKAPDSVSSDVTFTLPSADGTANQAIATNGSGVLSFASFGIQPTTETYDTGTAATWTKPTNATVVLIEVWGGGGSGGVGGSANGGGGGGGGACNQLFVRLSDLQGTVTYTVGAGGASKSGAGNGNAGGTTSVEMASFAGVSTKTLYAYGGGRGAGNTNSGAGGGGGGIFGAGGDATTVTAGLGGAPDNTGFGGGDGGGTTCFSQPGVAGVFGGGGGGGGHLGSSGAVGGNSMYGGGGGGGGEGTGSGGRAGGTSVLGGDGSAGQTASTSSLAGSIPAGGSGGTETGNSGAGAGGRVRFTYW